MMTDAKQPPSRIEQSLHIADVSIESDIGLTEVEKLAHGIERMRENRLVVPFAVRKRLLNECQKVARATNNKGRIPLENLIVLRDKAQEEVEAQNATLLRRVGHAIGFFNESKLYLDVLERAVQRVAEELDSDFFYYQDFAFYFTRQISRWPWFRSSFITYLLVVLSYYLFTPILFCVFLRDEQVCPTEKAYGGWLTALYFASTTLSTGMSGDGLFFTLSLNDV